VRFAADVLNGIPSVVIGLFAYAAFVLPFGHFSAWAGGAALAIMMVPTVARTTEEILKLVPSSYREASAGLGAKKVQTIVKVVIPAAKSGIISGIMLAIARIAGETAPLLFTAFGNDHVVTNPSQPISSLTLKIYVYAISPYQDWVQQAWAGALVLLAMVFVFGLIARFATRAAPVTR
ncbi:MAG TPA: phosphate ABC transporter permease PstA, partial [Fimbriimonadaceae bacterium]|nr:phosphate ABC transporter permease PstA [Fimbriimonadaceae bacterium]